MKIDHSDLKYFAAHALTGLASNPFLMSPDGKLHLQRQGLTIEKIALKSALQMIGEIEAAIVTLNRLEAEANPKGTVHGINESTDAKSSPSA